LERSDNPGNRTTAAFPTLKALAKIAAQLANAFSVSAISDLRTQGCANPGLEFANAFGVKKTATTTERRTHQRTPHSPPHAATTTTRRNHHHTPQPPPHAATTTTRRETFPHRVAY
jgi:hypothetical protein